MPSGEAQPRSTAPASPFTTFAFISYVFQCPFSYLVLLIQNALCPSASFCVPLALTWAVTSRHAVDPSLLFRGQGHTNTYESDLTLLGLLERHKCALHPEKLCLRLQMDDSEEETTSGRQHTGRLLGPAEASAWPPNARVMLHCCISQNPHGVRQFRLDVHASQVSPPLDGFPSPLLDKCRKASSCSSW